jgi:hypothetical protein
VTFGCKSESRQRAERLETSISWIATLETVGHAWGVNRVPARYAERTIDEARAALARNGEARAADAARMLGQMVRLRNPAALDWLVDGLARERHALEIRLNDVKRAP